MNTGVWVYRYNSKQRETYSNYISTEQAEAEATPRTDLLLLNTIVTTHYATVVG